MNKTIFLIFLILLLKEICVKNNFITAQDNKSVDSIENSYYSYEYINVNVGYSLTDDLAMSILSKRLFFNISYSISNFFNPIESALFQIGLFNEAGMNNLSAYFNVGPEARLFGNFYLIPYGGVSFIIVGGPHNGGIGFIYYLGGSSGLNIDITKNIKAELELGVQTLLIENRDTHLYFKIGTMIGL